MELTRSYEPLKTLISDQPFLYFFLFLLPALLFFSFSIHSMDLFRQVTQHLFHNPMMLRLIGRVRHLAIEFVVTLVDLLCGHLFHKRTLRCYHVSSLKGLVGQLAIEFVITLVESEWAPGDLRQLSTRNIITRNYAIQMRLLLWDIEDDAKWNSAENEDEDGGESSNYILLNGKDCLYRLSSEFDIVPVAFQQLPVYLYSPRWQERLAGLVAFAQLNLFRHRIPDHILEQVLTVALNLFRHHPHPRVRQAAINAIDELFYKSNWDFQLQCYNRVLPALSKAIYEDPDQCVTSAAFNAALHMYEHFNKNLPLSRYLYPGNWQKCLVGLVAIAQIAKFRPQVEILNLEHVLTRVLSLFQDPPHPGVRWAAIDAIGHLSNYVGPAFQLRFQDCVLQTLTSALWDIQDTEKTFDQLLLDLFQNSHRPVRSAAIAAILELSNGLAPTLPAPAPFQVRFHLFVLPALVAAMSAFQYPEVQDDAASAMEIISENYPGDTSPYLCHIVDNLLEDLRREDIASDQTRIRTIGNFLKKVVALLPHDTIVRFY